MIPSLPHLAFARLPAAPPPGSIQFFNGYVSTLTPGMYTIGLQQTIAAPLAAPSAVPPVYAATQQFVITAPEFSIDPAIIHTMYPPPGSSDAYGEQVPWIVLAHPALPWERALTPGSGLPDQARPTPWLALLVLAEGEVYVPAGSNTPVQPCTVEDLLAVNPDVLKPQLPAGAVTREMLASQCETITIPGVVFNAVAPQRTDLPLLAHCRAMAHAEQGETLFSAVMSNRLALADLRVTPPTALRYYAHLVSLEGLASYLGPNGTPIPQKATQAQLQDVQLVSLASWSFTSLPQGGTDFASLMGGLKASESLSAAFALPVPTDPAPPPVQSRLQDGYVPLTFVTGFGERGFSWYRGPFTPVVPQPLPPVGTFNVDASHAPSADALMIYLAGDRLFDLSYAAAWNIGRELALADAHFAQALTRYRRRARAAASMIAQRMGLPHLSGLTEPADALDRHASRRRFSAAIGEGLGRDWTEALTTARNGARPPARTAFRVARARDRRAFGIKDVLALPGVADALGENVQETAGEIARWLATLSLLTPVPASHLLPDPRLLPVESIRFFYVDPGWIEALLGGALSIAVHDGADVMLGAALRPKLDEEIVRQRGRPFHPAWATTGGTPMTGVLIRSALVAGWPGLAVTPTLGGAPLPVARDVRLAPSVRLVLFDGVPDVVTLAEPYQGLRFGVEGDRVVPRCVTAAAVTGSPISNVAPVKFIPRPPPQGWSGGVLDVQATAAALHAVVGPTPFTSGARVQWDDRQLNTVFVSADLVRATVPDALISVPGTVLITVTQDGAVSSPMPFTITPPLAITGIDPAVVVKGAPAFVLTVEGVGFAQGTIVRWNDRPLPTSVIGSMRATAKVEASDVAGEGTIPVTVVTGALHSAPVTLQVITGRPTIATLVPNVTVAGCDGIRLTVRGTGFTPACTVLWQGSPLVSVWRSALVMETTVPRGLLTSQGVANVTVVDGDAASPPATFVIAGSTPVIGSIEPNVGMAGGNAIPLLVTGANFGAGAEIQWNGRSLPTTPDGTKRLTATVPASDLAAAGTVSVTVKVGGESSLAVTFVVLGAQPGIGRLDPSSAVAGAVGFTLEVAGGFGSGDFALQFIRAPLEQSFVPSTTSDHT